MERGEEYCIDTYAYILWMISGVLNGSYPIETLIITGGFIFLFEWKEEATKKNNEIIYFRL